MQNYYEINLADEERWNLAILDNFVDGSPVDIWAYHQCKLIVDPRPVPFRVQVMGKRVDFNPTAFSAIVVSQRMADVIERTAPNDLQRIPVVIDGEQGGWEIINVLPCVDCIDRQASLMQYYPADHPAKAGKPRGVIRLVLDPSRIGSHHIFHPKDWRVATIVSEDVRNALDEIGATGMEYVPVTRLAIPR